jgi:YVTN family beta-propeller protein
LKQKVLGFAAIAAGVLLLGSCGGSITSSSGGAPPTSGLTKRAFVSNEFGNAILIVNASNDTLNSHTIATDAGPQTIAVSQNKTNAVVFNAAGNFLDFLDNATETVTHTGALAGYTDSLAMSPDGIKAYAAVRNAPSSTGTPLGVVTFLNTSTGAVTSVDVPLARRLVLSPNGGKLLVFSDNSNSVTVIDEATLAVTVVPGFDRPVWGVFSGDGSKAYIMNCGPECGGTTASVTELDNIATTPTLGTNTPVSAATVGLLDGSSLYVAGTVTAGAGGGRLDVLNAGTLAVTQSGVVISDGTHTTMAISNGHVFVGARACSNVAEGCLSIYSGGATATIGTPKGEVTGMQAISGRTRVYVVEGGELRIYDSSSSTEVLPAPVNVVGKAWDVKAID